jgi:subtilisin family serine protease
MRQRILIGLAALAVFSLAARGDEAMPAWAFTQDTQPLRTRHDIMARLGVNGWHATGFRGKGVKVAVLDSGFRGYRDQRGKALPEAVAAKSARRDGNVESKDSQHGILCGEIVHALAPDAEIVFINWDGDSPESFLDAVRLAKEEGARIVTCSVIAPSWSDGEGGGSVHKELASILGDGTRPDDMVFFASAGNVAERHWAGTFKAGEGGYHLWADTTTANTIKPWTGERADRVALELCWSDPETRYKLEVIDTATGEPAAACEYKSPEGRLCVVARFNPVAGTRYAVRAKVEKGTGGKFHFTSLAADLGCARAAGSIPFPGDGPEVVTVGAVDATGRRSSYSACGPNSCRPKPDLVAPVPFPSYFRAKPFSGTSSASPQAAALAALCWSLHNDWSAARVRSYLVSAARDVGPIGHDCETGYGVARLPGVVPVVVPHFMARW